jgi:PAS domain S-box-containing protein
LEEEAIRRRALFERSTDGIVVMDAGGAVCELNQSFADMLGYSLEEAGRLHVWDWDVQWNRDQLIEKIANDPKVTFETRHRRKDGSIYDVEISSNAVEWRGQLLRFCVCRDITERKRAQAQIKTLSGLLPICAWCKKIRDDSGYWRQLEIYVSEHSEADFSHGICPECAEEVYPVRARDGDR